MKLTRIAAGIAAAATLALAPAAAASAHDAGPGGGGPGLLGPKVLVQLNGGSGNSIVAYTRGANGALHRVGYYSTHGLGGKQVGAPVDALASQGSLAIDGDSVIAVNAGSNTVTALDVHASSLSARSVVPSGGQFPSSVTVHDDLVYVLNAGGTGVVTGFRLVNHVLVAIPGATESLGLANDPVPAFLASPSQLGLTPDGHTLVVATKSHNTLVTFPVHRDGTLGAAIVTASTGPVPFSFVFDRANHLQVTQAGDGALATYRVNPDSTLTALGASAPSGQAALCWNVIVGHTVYGANAGSATLSSWTAGWRGAATLRAAVAAKTSAGPIDLTAAGGYLYVLSGLTGHVDTFATHRNGTPTKVGTVTGLPVLDTTGGPEGIAAS